MEFSTVECCNNCMFLQQKCRKDELIKTSSKSKWNRNPRTICGENTAIDSFLQNNVRTRKASPSNMIKCGVSEYQGREKKDIVICLLFLIFSSYKNSYDLRSLNTATTFFLPERLLSKARELYEQASDSMSFHISCSCM